MTSSSGMPDEKTTATAFLQQLLLKDLCMSFFTVNLLLNQLLYQQALEELLQKLPNYPKPPANQSATPSRCSPPYSCSTLHSRFLSSVEHGATAIASPPNSTDTDNGTAENASPALPAPPSIPTVCSPPTSGRRGYMRCNRPLQPQLEDVPVPAPVHRANQYVSQNRSTAAHNQEEAFTEVVTKRKRKTKQQVHISKFTSYNIFSALQSKRVQPVHSATPPSTTTGQPTALRTSQTPKINNEHCANATGRRRQFRPSTNKLTRRHGMKKGMPYCRSRTGRAPRVLQVSPVLPPSRPWKQAPNLNVPVASPRPRETPPSTPSPVFLGAVCTNFHELKARKTPRSRSTSESEDTPNEQSEPGGVSDDDIDLPTLENSSSSSDELTSDHAPKGKFWESSSDLSSGHDTEETCLPRYWSCAQPQITTATEDLDWLDGDHEQAGKPTHPSPELCRASASLIPCSHHYIWATRSPWCPQCSRFPAMNSKGNCFRCNSTLYREWRVRHRLHDSFLYTADYPAKPKLRSPVLHAMGIHP